MFTSNYITLRDARFSGSDAAYFKHCNGSHVQCYLQYMLLDDIGYWMNRMSFKEMPTDYSTSGIPSACGIHVGTDPTPASKSDYKLGAPITSGLSASSGGLLTQKEADGRWAIFSQFILTNTSEVEINIWEIGIFTAVNADNSFNSRQTWPVLMERTVFDEPITIQPGEQKLLIYKLTFNQTMNVE